jgi:hypothetical protein
MRPSKPRLDQEASRDFASARRNERHRTDPRAGVQADHQLALVSHLRPNIESIESPSVRVKKRFDPTIVSSPGTDVAGVHDDRRTMILAAKQRTSLALQQRNALLRAFAPASGSTSPIARYARLLSDNYISPATTTTSPHPARAS